MVTNNLASNNNVNTPIVQNQPAVNVPTGPVAAMTTTLSRQYNAIANMTEALGPHVIYDIDLMSRILDHKFDVDPSTGKDPHLDTLAQQLKNNVFVPQTPIAKPGMVELYDARKWFIGNPINFSFQRTEMREQFNAHCTADTVYDAIAGVYTNKWYGYENVQVFERNGAYWVIEPATAKGQQAKQIEIANYILHPISKITIKNQDMRETYVNFDLVIKGHKNPTASIVLKDADFHTSQNFQKAVGKQVSGIRTYVPQSHIRGLNYKLTELDWENMQHAVKQGTSILGYERFKLGKDANGDDIFSDKYFCTKDGRVFKEDGTVSQDVVFVHPKHRLEEDQEAATDRYGNMDFDPIKWPVILQHIAENFMKLNKKDEMLKYFGWLLATAFDYNVRQASGEFPLFHVSGQPGSGKSLTVRALAQFFGYAKKDIDNYPTPPALKQNLTISYTLPAFYDEYGGGDKDDGWDKFRFEKTHAIMKHCFVKSVDEVAGKGEGGQGKFRYKIRNPLCSLGQRPILSNSVADRTIQIDIDGSLKLIQPEGQIAYDTANDFAKYNDHNFVLGYNMWAMRQDDADVQAVVKKLITINNRAVKRRKLTITERQRQALAVVQMGLYYFLKLCKEHNIKTTYTLKDILSLIYTQAKFNVSVASKASVDPMTALLKDLSTHINSYGKSSNHQKPVYGDGQAVMVGKRKFAKGVKPTPGTYGSKSNIEDSCVFGHKYVAVKLDAIITIINKDLHNARPVHVASNIQTYIRTAFKQAEAKGGDGLVMAPDQFNINYTKANGSRGSANYTIFNMEHLKEHIDGVFEINDFWDGNTL